MDFLFECKFYDILTEKEFKIKLFKDGCINANSKKILLIIVVSFLVFSILAFLGIHIAYQKVFSRANYSEYDADKYLVYKDISSKYPRKTVTLNSGNNKLAGYIYGTGNSKGLIVISPGHRDPNDVKLYEIMYFVDAGWNVLSYDYTGCYNSTGDSMVGYTQSVADLDAVLHYVETEKYFSKMQVMLFGHSLGAYASTAVLQYRHPVTAVVAASGFDDPTEQWEYSIERFTGIFGGLLNPYAKVYIDFRLGDKKELTAIKGINSTNIPVLLISGTNDEFYGGESKIFERRTLVTNPNCIFRLMTKKNHSGHYDYFLTDASIEYRKQVESGKVSGPVNKELYMEHDKQFMNSINDFFTKKLVE
jgi:pimeloyl-ACP methyl ester carboxylesterase